MLKEALRQKLSAAEIELLSSSFDVIGDIAIIKIPPELSPRERIIGEEILEHMSNVRTVLKQDSDVEGEYRLRNVSPIAGEDKRKTLYKESGVSIAIDVSLAYFSPRLSTERLRIASLVSNGEKILNMFAGVGSFSFVIAKTKTCDIASVDINPSAIGLAIESLKLNRKLKGTVNPIQVDARSFALEHPGEFDRILMPLPERASEFLSAAFASAKEDSDSMIHYYVHVPDAQFHDSTWISKHLEALDLPRKWEVVGWKKVREVGPRFIQAVADIRLG